MSEIRTVEIDGTNWLVLADVLASVGRASAIRNPMFVARIPGDERQQVKLDGRWTWLVTEFGADWAAGQDWRKHGDPAVYGYDRAATRAYAAHGPEMYDRPKSIRPAKEPKPKQRRAFERIADEYRQKIRTGEIAVGQMLPRSRDVAEEWGLARGNVVKAYQVLRDEGLALYEAGTHGGYRVVEVAK